MILGNTSQVCFGDPLFLHAAAPVLVPACTPQMAGRLKSCLEAALSQAPLSVDETPSPSMGEAEADGSSSLQVFTLLSCPSFLHDLPSVMFLDVTHSLSLSRTFVS